MSKSHFTHLLQQLIELDRLPNLKIARLDTSVVDTQDHIHILHRLRAHIRKLLDLSGSVLDLIVGHDEVELLHTGLDCVPAGQTVANSDVSGHTEIGGVEDLVCGWVGQDCLGVDTGLVCEGAETGNVVVADVVS